MVPGWVPFKIMSDSPALHSRWPLLLKIEISSNGQNCSILSQNAPKFELYKHNDEPFNMYYRNCYEFWTFADFDWLCKLEKGGWNWKKKLLFLSEFPLGSYVKLNSAVGAILVEGPNRRIHFWKRTIQWLSHLNFVLIEQMVSDKKISMGISHRVLC
jgi:hypothetical protein